MRCSLRTLEIRNNTDFGEAELVKSTHNGWEELEEENKKTCVDI